MKVGRMAVRADEIASILKDLRKDLERVLADEGLIERYVAFRRSR